MTLSVITRTFLQKFRKYEPESNYTRAVKYLNEIQDRPKLYRNARARFTILILSVISLISIVIAIASNI